VGERVTRARILGTGSALPPRTLTNAELERIVDTTDAWISGRTGIRERRILDAGQSTSDLAASAALKACQSAGLRPADLDCIIVATVTPDRPLPSTAVYVQRKLGAGPCAAFDVSAACGGFLYGLAIADAFVRSCQFQRVLVVGVEVLSRIVDWRDRNTCVLFGDGAGAVVVAACEPEAEMEGRGILSVHLNADGCGAEELMIVAGGSSMPTSTKTVCENLHTVRMNGKAVFSHAVRRLAASCQIALATNQLCSNDVDLVIAHQANLRIIEAVAERCALPMDRFYLNIEKYGNTSSASVPIALDEAVKDGSMRKGMTVLLCAFGAGFTWGSAVIRW
jgi:3-oxoacyl-[acyl-carrier-protein] synthase-3